MYKNLVPALQRKKLCGHDKDHQLMLCRDIIAICREDSVGHTTGCVTKCSFVMCSRWYWALNVSSNESKN
jgi:hypothetical protein